MKPESRKAYWARMKANAKIVLKEQQVEHDRISKKSIILRHPIERSITSRPKPRTVDDAFPNSKAHRGN